jgi:hypothetical protein
LKSFLAGNSHFKTLAAGLLAVGIFSGIIRCSYSFNKYSPSTATSQTPTPTPTAPVTAGTFTISAGSATIETPSDLELSSGTLQLKTLTTEDWGCAYTGASSTSTGTELSYNGVQSAAHLYGEIFTPPTYVKVNSIKQYLKKTGAPSGTFNATLYNSDGTKPTSLLATGGSINFTSLSAIASNSLKTFSLSSPVELSGSLSYAVVNNLQPITYDGVGTYYSWVGSSLGADCTAFGLAQQSNDTGSTWSASTLKNYFLINVDKHSTSGSASWIVLGIGGTWDMSSFEFSENSNGLTTGAITYDIGTGSSGVTAAYTDLSLTKAQVQALNDKTGTYLYVRANFSISAQGYNNATLVNGSIISY